MSEMCAGILHSLSVCLLVCYLIVELLSLFVCLGFIVRLFLLVAQKRGEEK